MITGSETAEWESEEGEFFQAQYTWSLAWVARELEWLIQGLEEEVILKEFGLNASSPVTITSAMHLVETSITI